MIQLAAGIAAVAGIVSGVAYLVKYFGWLFVKTPEQKKEDIDHAVDEAQKKEQETGRPAKP